MDIPGMKYGYNPPAKFRDCGELSICEAPRDKAEMPRSCLNVIDEHEIILFTVYAVWDPETQQCNQDDLWWRAECLVHYFNLPAPSGEFY